jgi:hypothetical protein
MTRAPVPPPAERLYAALLWLYPPSFRRRFGLDMRELFRDSHREASRREVTGAWPPSGRESWST